MKFCTLLVLAVLAGPASAQPVHVALKPSVTVSPDANGFFTLGSVADMTGGDKPLRTRLAAIQVGRAPLSGETRRLTRGDLSLKLRQAGCDPEKVAIFEGAATAEVSLADGPLPSSVPATNAASSPPGKGDDLTGRAPAPPVSLEAGPRQAAPIVHRGDAVTIVIQSGPLTINAAGVARGSGGAGDTIRVHREGVMTDLTVQVLDAQTVQLGI